MASLPTTSMPFLLRNPSYHADELLLLLHCHAIEVCALASLPSRSARL